MGHAELVSRTNSSWATVAGRAARYSILSDSDHFSHGGSFARMSLASRSRLNEAMELLVHSRMLSQWGQREQIAWFLFNAETISGSGSSSG